MASRRRPSRTSGSRTSASSSSRGSAGTASRGSAGSRARAANMRAERTGKSQVPCPSCGTEYIIPAAQMNDLLECSECGRTFMPSKASRAGLRAGNDNPAKPYLIGAGVLIALLVILAIADSGDPPADNDNSAKSTEKAISYGSDNPRVAGCIKFVDAMRQGERFELSRWVAADDMRKSLGITNLDGSADEVNARVITTLLEHDSVPVFKDSHVTTARVREADAEADSGQVTMTLLIDQDKQKEWGAYTAELMVRFVLKDGTALAAGFEWIEKPVKRALRNASREKPTVHEEIGRAEDVERVYNGVKETVREAELTPLGHLEDTPQETREEIDRQIAQLIDLDAGGHMMNRAIFALKKIGKPAVPRLLNQMYEIPADTNDNLFRLRRIEAALKDLTGQRMGFDPSVVGETPPDVKREKRESALKQWYGWWADNHWRSDIDYAKEKLDDPNLLEDIGGEKPNKSGR